MNETKCGCPARKALADLLAYVTSPDGPGADEEYIEPAFVALSAPCPCVRLRATIDGLREGWTEDRERLREENAVLREERDVARLLKLANNILRAELEQLKNAPTSR